MKKNTDKILSLLLVSSLAGYFLLFFISQDISSPPAEFVVLWYSAPVIPACCFQLLLCRNIKRKWLAALPAVLLTGWCLLCLVQILINTGWDALGWAIFLALSITPAAGFVLAWAVFGFWNLQQKSDIHNQ